MIFYRHANLKYKYGSRHFWCTLRFNAGYNGKEYVFELYNKDGRRTAYIDDDGNLTICGIFKTGEEGEARTVIDGNGIQSYNENNQLHGLVSNPDGRHGDLAAYYRGKEYFRVYNGIDGPSMFANGHTFLNASSNGATGMGSWEFENGATGSFMTADGKVVTIVGGLITKIQ